MSGGTAVAREPEGGVIATPSQPVSAEPAAVRSASQTGLYRVVWRWHFYAGLLTAPFLFVLAVTGLIYIFSPEIEQVLRRDRLFVEPATTPLPPSAWGEASLRDQPGWRLARLSLRPEADRTVQISLQATEGKQQQDVYINPYTAAVIARQDPEADAVHRFFRLVLNIHRRLVLGTTGRVVVELCTCWGALLTATGIYLWWPRRREKVQGVWLPRLRGKPYVVLRDLHAVASVYLTPVILLIVITGLFYSVVWGKGAFAVSTVANAGLAGLSAAEKPVARAPAPRVSPPLPVVDAACRAARDAFPERTLILDFDGTPAKGIPVFAITDFAFGTYGPYRINRLTVDGETGIVTSDEPFTKNPGRWWHAWTYPLHVGSFWGPATKIVWFLACVVLASLPVTGLWMWWKRRPVGQTGFPRPADGAWPWWLALLVVANGLVFPLAGASLLLFMLFEWGLRRFRGRSPQSAAAE